MALFVVHMPARLPSSRSNVKVNRYQRMNAICNLQGESHVASAVRASYNNLFSLTLLQPAKTNESFMRIQKTFGMSPYLTILFYVQLS